MQVKQRLRINSVVSVVTVLAIIFVFFLTIQRVNRAFEAAGIADAILTASFERLILRTDLQRTGSERSKTQLIAKHAQIGDLLKAALNKFPAPDDQKTVNDLLTIHESIGKISKTLRINREKRKAAQPDALSEESEDRLLSQLNMRVYETILLDSKLQQSSKAAVHSSLKLAGGGILLAILVITVSSMINAAIMNLTIAVRIRKLLSGVAEIGGGNLGHRIDIKGDDEFAELSTAFNEMTVKLRGSYQALEGEVAERKLAENELRKAHEELELRIEERTKELSKAEQGLREMNETLELRIAERTAELSAANTLLNNSRRAALNMMEDAVAARSQSEEAITGLEREAMERKRAEDASRRATEQWELTFNSVPDLITIMDGEHRIVRANRAMAERLGITAEQCIGRECYLGVHGAGQPLHFCPHALTLADGREHSAEVHEERLGGYFLVTTTPLLDGHGKMTGTVHVARDITAIKIAEKALQLAHDELEKRVEQRTIELASAMNALNHETEERIRTLEDLREKDRMLLQQSRLAAMGEMINNIAHQWRQPLNLLGLNIQKLLLFYDLGEFNRDLLASGTEEAMALIKHMSQTIDDFRTFFMPDREKSDFNLLLAAQKAVALIQDGLKSDHIEVAMQIDDTIKINGFQNEFCQVIMNILQNARDALHERRIANGRIILASSAQQGKIVITIADNAGGIPVEIIDRIFEPYFSTKGLQGTGIGLYMSKQIIETKMEGVLTARNNVEGAEFIIEI